MTGAVQFEGVLNFFIIAVPSAAILFILIFALNNIKLKMIGKITYNREFSKTDVTEGEEVYITETVCNPSILPLLFIDISSYIDGRLRLEGGAGGDGMQQIVSRFNLLPFSKVTRTHKVVCTRRGHYKMTSASIIGNSKKEFEHQKFFYFDSELFVYPKPVPQRIPTHAINYRYGVSNSTSKIASDPFNVVGIRDYAPGDPFRSINFKATARSAYQSVNFIKINRLDPSSDRIVVLFLNFHRPKALIKTGEFEKKLEYELSICASFVKRLLDSGDRVGLAANCKLDGGAKKLSFPIRNGRDHSTNIMRALSSAGTDEGVSFYSLVEGEVLRGLSMSEIIIVTPCVDENVEKAAALLGKRNSVEVIKV